MSERFRFERGARASTSLLPIHTLGSFIVNSYLRTYTLQSPQMAAIYCISNIRAVQEASRGRAVLHAESFWVGVPVYGEASQRTTLYVLCRPVLSTNSWDS